MLRYSFGNIDGKAYGLNANEMSVYEAIGKCCRKDNARGWYADMQTLADQLPHRIGRVTVSRAVDKLLTLGLIRRDGKSLFIDVQNERVRVQNEQADVQNEQADVQNEQNPTPPLYPPINNYNEMERENTRTCVPAHDTAIPTIPSFIDFVSLVREMGQTVSQSDIDKAYDYWTDMTDIKKYKLFWAVKNGTWQKPRLDWLITDFPEPKPTILSGIDQDCLWRQGKVPCLVKYDGRFVAVTEQEMNLFGLEFVRKIYPANDCY